MWDVATGVTRFTFPTSLGAAVNSVKYSPDEKYILVSEAHGLATLWDANTGIKIRSFGIAEENYYGLWAEFLPNSNHILSSFDKKAVIWDSTSGKIVQTFHYNSDYFVSSVSNDGKLAMSPGKKPPDYSVVIWDVQTGKVVHTIEDQEGHWSPKARYITTSTSGLERLQIWNAKTYSLIHTFNVGLGGHFSPDERYFILAEGQGTNSLWNTQTWKKLVTFKAKTSFMVPVFVLNKPSIFMFRDNETNTIIQEWTLGNLREVARFTLPESLGALYSFALMPSEETIVTSSVNGFLRLWDLRTAREIRSFC
jgi:WD40 repeat protein